jgi:hypothetical protein
MRGRDGAERYPQATDVPLEEAVLRQLRRLDRSLTLPWVQDAIALYDEPEVLRALHQTLLKRPNDVKAFFRAQFRPIVPSQPTPVAPPAVSIRSLPDDDPYAI